MLTPISAVKPGRARQANAGLRFSPEQINLLRRAFPGLDEISLVNLASMTRERVLPPGYMLCTEGQIEDTFYLICSGRVMVSQRLGQDTSRLLAYRGPGEFIGEMSLLLENLPRTADVMTINQTTVLEIERAMFSQLLQRSPSVVLAILRVLANRLREADQQTMVDLRQKYAQLAEAYRKLREETNRRSEFLTSVAHELRTPLTVIKGYLTLMRAGALSGEVLRQTVKTMAGNLDTITRLINNVLLLQEVELVAPQVQAVSVHKLLDDLVGAIQGAGNLPNNLTIRAEISPDLPLIRGDPDGLRHAFGAILDNAIKFSPEGGEVRLRAWAAEGKLCVQVRDHGIGIAPDEMPHIFDHFHHLDAAGAHVFGGIGLGLPLAKAVVEQHCGSIQVESELGKGSVFTVALPIEDAA